MEELQKIKTMTELVITKEFIHLLSSVKRDGIDELIAYLVNNSFFQCKFFDEEHSENRTVAKHSLLVYNILKHLNSQFNVNLDEESMIVVSLLHDMSRIDMRNEFPVGHSEKSIFMIQKFIQLTEEEIIAINSHMGQSDLRSHGAYNDFEIQYDISKLALFLHISDMMSSSYVENWRYDCE